MAYSRHFGLAMAAGVLMGAVAGAGEAGPTARPFRAGDRWVAVGDSITHGGRYHSFVYLFYATRYPGREFRVFNAGVSGDSAAGAVQRFDWDIAIHEPTVVTVMLGMNDVNRGLYAPGQTSEAVDARRKAALGGHLKAMAQLAERLRGAGCRVVFLTPSIYDQTGTQQTENCAGVNDALGQCGAGAVALAQPLHGEVADLHGPMTALNARLQQADPALTLVGPDRVHPGAPGHLVMAYLILKAQGVAGTVAEMTLDAAGRRVTGQETCRISETEWDDGSVRFTCLEEALPFPVAPAAEPALAWVPLMADLNREVLRVTGLRAGSYAVLIDGQPVAAATAAELAAGLDLAANPRSPMLRQALAVMAIEEKRHEVASRLRTFAAQRHWLTWSKPGLNPDDFEAMKAALLADLETKKGLPNYGYFKGQVDTYLTWKPREAELQQQLADHTAAIWKANQPAPHRFEVRPLAAADQALLAGRVLDEGDDAGAWQRTSWTDTEPVLTIANGCLMVSAPRTADRRDMLGLSKAVHASLADAGSLHIRYRADKGAPFGVEAMLDGALVRLRSYEPATGDWEELALPVKAARLTSLTLILAEPGEAAAWPTERVSYEFDRVWVE